MATPNTGRTRAARAENRHEVIPPRAAAMIESMRAFGYSTPSAIADLVDNSLSAGAANVWVTFHWDGEDSRVAIADDGEGMGEAELSNAMRLGSQSPREQRLPQDLGRFGLGLKTASFSQGRSLTVASQRAGQETATRRWDLDHVEATQEWCLLFEPTPVAQPVIARLPGDGSGTVVVWEKLDRLIGDADTDDEQAHDRFLAGAEQVEEHLAMTFHRFLSGPRRASIWINGQRVEPWDPFLEEERFTQRLPEEILTHAGERIVVSPFVLPHHTKLSSQRHRSAAGPRGWNAQQGYYVYRSQRLLVSGDWLRLGFQKEEHYKLARIRIDLPNSMDAAWQIDVRKATARPPGGLRADLRRIAEVTRKRASDIYRHRGKALSRSASSGPTFLWRQSTRHGKLRYAIERDHPVIRQALTEDPEVERILRLIEETVPVPLITLNAAEHPDQLAAPFEGADEREVRRSLERVYGILVEHGLSAPLAREQLARMEPFDSFPQLVATVGERT